MRLSLRAKLIGIVGVASLAFVAVIVTGAVSAARTEAQLASIQERYLPKIEAGPQLEAQFERLRRGMQDAVAARDSEALSGTREQLDDLLARIAAARDAVDAQTAERLRLLMEDYYQASMDVSRRLIAGETGEHLLDAMTAMQEKQVHASERLTAAVWFDRKELTAAFATASQAEVTAGRFRLATAMACLALVILMSFGLGRGVLRSLQALTGGLERFGRGDFSQPIAVRGNDELGAVAVQANRMAQSLHGFSEQRDRTDWLKGALVGLGQELRGELDPTEVGVRAVAFLTRYLDLPAAALYHVDADQTLRLMAAHAGVAPSADRSVVPRFRVGEGLLGQAALQEEIVVISEPPADYLRIRSGLGEGAPRALVFVPLWHLGRATAVLEVASFAAWPARSTEALLALRENLVIAIEVARGRASTRELLAETQRQTVRLREQEDELRATNDMLEKQQETLRRTNQDLKDQANELEVQRRVLERNNAELDEAKRRVEQKASELATVSSYKSRFLANMSHELRTPLNSMLLLSNLLAENDGKRLTEKQVEFARTIHRSGQDLLGLINQVLDLAKIEAGKHDIRVTSMAMRPLADNLRSLFEPMARVKGLDLSITVAPEAPEQLPTDGRRVEQILKNLIANALKFTERGRVVLEIKPPTASMTFARPGLHSGNTVAFAVSDTGVGVAPEDQHRIFAPFEQVEGNVDRRFGGTGLGLSISRELVTLLGGELQVNSTVGRGSTFTCLLPLAGPPTSPDAVLADGLPRPESTTARPRPPAPSSPAGLASDEPCLLIVEDDPIFAEVVAETIRQRGMAAVIALNGHTGLQLARDRKPVGIVLDVKLPDIDGWRVMELLRSDPVTASIPVHFLSALNAPERGLALGAVGFLMKPTTRSDLRGMVASLTRKSNGQVLRLLVVEEETISGESVTLLLEGEKLHLHRVTSVSEASEALERERFACLILDLSRSDAGWLPLLRELRERHGDKMPPVIVYTPRSLSSPEVAEIEAYAGAVVLKDGASSERLLEEVRHFIVRLTGGTDDPALTTTRATVKDPRLNGRKILIVDDDMRTVYALSALLRAKGAVVVVGDNGQAALEVLDKTFDVDAVLMDIMMPEMDGYEATRRLRRNPRFVTLPIIVLTAKAMAGEAKTCIEAGASAYLPKPVDADRVLELLIALLPPQKAEAVADEKREEARS